MKTTNGLFVYTKENGKINGIEGSEKIGIKNSRIRIFVPIFGITPQLGQVSSSLALKIKN
jgi:hypothetical protein